LTDFSRSYFQDERRGRDCRVEIVKRTVRQDLQNDPARVGPLLQQRSNGRESISPEPIGSCRHWPFWTVRQMNDTQPRPQGLQTPNQTLTDRKRVGDIVDHWHVTIAFSVKKTRDIDRAGKKPMRMVFEDDRSAGAQRLLLLGRSICEILCTTGVLTAAAESMRRSSGCER
jgi:hypothetical protein